MNPKQVGLTFIDTCTAKGEADQRKAGQYVRNAGTVTVINLSINKSKADAEAYRQKRLREWEGRKPTQKD